MRKTQPAAPEPPRAPKREYVYRREPTPGGVAKMQRGELEHFDLEMYANFNTGVLEEYLDRKNRRDGFLARWRWSQVLTGLAVGAAFALINVYVGLKIGLLVYGAWYVAYLVGLGGRWRPAEINLSAGAANGASFMATGFVYVFPAIFLLSSLNPNLQAPLVSEAALPKLAVAMVAAILCGVLGTLYFTMFRRVWLVEDPLPYPSFESFVKLLDMANEISDAAAERARHGVRLVLAFTGVAAVFTFLRDFPLWREIRRGGEVATVSTFDHALAGKSWWGAGGVLQQPLSTAQFTWLSFTLSPLLVAVGWFMRLRAALMVAAGTAFAWFVAVPLAVYFNVPTYVPAFGGEVGLHAIWASGRPSALFAFNGVIRTLAAGTIVGAGLMALLRMAPTMKGVAADLLRLRGREDPDTRPYVAGRGWYEWPARHILVVAGVVAVALPAVFTLGGGYPLVGSVAFTLIFLLTSFLLGAIACKVLGETSIEPVSGTSFIVFLLTFGVLSALGLPLETTVVLGLLGTTVYATAISMTGDVLLDAKNALYVGARPYHQMKAGLTGVVPGAIVGVLAATLLSIGLARGTLDFAAPQANAFATLVGAFTGGHVNPTVLLLGFAFGVLVEALTGMGTAFALGMFFPIGLTAPLLLGGALRDGWEKYWLHRRAEKKGWNEEKKTIRLLDTYMVATGLIVGEALVGTLVAVWLTGALLFA